jgi:hypothetical protein
MSFDWVELYNPGSGPVNVAGMHLTDSSDALKKWQIPNDRPDLTTIPAKAYLLVWLDSDTADAGLHADARRQHLLHA